MSLPAYPRYKDSGVEWLGEVPEHWEVKRSDAFLSYSREQLAPADFHGVEVVHYSIPAVQESGIGQLEDGSEIASGKQIVRKRVVLVSKLNPRKATICIAEPQNELTLCSTEFVALEPIGCEVHYLSYLVRAEGFRQSLESKVTSVTKSHQRANPVDIYRFWNAWPSAFEQSAIAAFLDRETAKIDKLVAEQRRLIELLKEKRLAVISHAVTKGLNPDVPMKDSGVEWVGEVPEHWEVCPLMWLTDSERPIMYGIVLPGPDVGDGIPILKGGNVKSSRMNLESMARTTPEIEAPYARARLKEGDLVYSIRGSIGDCESVPSELEGSNITQDVARVAIANGAYATWARWALSSVAIREELASGSLGAAVRGINIFDLKRVRIPTPPADEQLAIASWISGETLKLDTLTAEAQRAIDLLLERRTALISAAVTGQVDVRDIAQSEAA